MRSRTAPAWKPFWRPSRPVRLIAPFPPGGVVDLYARLIGQWLSERLGQPFVIENRVGAGGNVGTEAVVREPPDGYTLLQVSSANAWNATLYDKLSFNFIRDIAPIASIYLSPAILVVHPSFPAKSVPELAAYAKANPGKINMASGGVGSAQHVYGELFKAMAGVDMLHVPYRGGGPALAEARGCGPSFISHRCSILNRPLPSMGAGSPAYRRGRNTRRPCSSGEVSCQKPISSGNTPKRRLAKSKPKKRNETCSSLRALGRKRRSRAKAMWGRTPCKLPGDQDARVDAADRNGSI
jgi:Tripartite tricarboxylate transporter family receptor